jgi:hypothetical protein
MDEKKPVPIIRMVFALAGREACVKTTENALTRTNWAQAAAKSTTKNKRTKKCPAYTTYDILCAKTSPKTFAVIRPGDERLYADLLNVSQMSTRHGRTLNPQNQRSGI